MYDVKMEKFDPFLANLIYNGSSDRMRNFYGIYGVMLVHWFFPASIDDIKRKLEGIVDGK